MTQQLTDKDIAGDVLTAIKHGSMGYMQAVLEAQDTSLRQTFKDYHDQLLDNQEQVFRYMQHQGWYQVPMNLE